MYSNTIAIMNSCTISSSSSSILINVSIFLALFCPTFVESRSQFRRTLLQEEQQQEDKPAGSLSYTTHIDQGCQMLCRASGTVGLQSNMLTGENTNSSNTLSLQDCQDTYSDLQIDCVGFQYTQYTNLTTRCELWNEIPIEFGPVRSTSTDDILEVSCNVKEGEYIHLEDSNCRTAGAGSAGLSPLVPISLPIPAPEDGPYGSCKTAAKMDLAYWSDSKEFKLEEDGGTGPDSCFGSSGRRRALWMEVVLNGEEDYQPAKILDVICDSSDPSEEIDVGIIEDCSTCKRKYGPVGGGGFDPVKIFVVARTNQLYGNLTCTVSVWVQIQTLIPTEEPTSTPAPDVDSLAPTPAPDVDTLAPTPECFGMLAAVPLSGCSGGLAPFEIAINNDAFPVEISWNLTQGGTSIDCSSSGTSSSYSTTSKTVCLEPGTYVFTITDSYGTFHSLNPTASSCR
mmetsp:Transcript_41580/g.99677  ORF Transcript_41580/g.99677 Transcript_41580/m.99677 type:complete len:453 (-) Transcript_41580:1331-2689(-)